MRSLPGLIGCSLGFALLLGTAQAASPAAPTLATVAVAAPILTPAGEGRRVFLKLNCYGCHGMRGAGGMGPNIVGAEAGDVNEVVIGGSDSGMPAFRNYVTSTDITNLTAYLGSIGTKTEPTFTHWWEAAPSQ